VRDIFVFLDNDHKKIKAKSSYKELVDWRNGPKVVNSKSTKIEDACIVFKSKKQGN